MPRGKPTQRPPEAEAAAIVERLRRPGVTLTSLMAEYHVGHARMRAVVLSAMTRRQWAALRRKKLAAGNKANRFEKGNVPWSAGRKGIHLSRATEFKAGALRGQAARHWVPVGTIHVRRDKAPRRCRHRANARPGPERRWIKIKDDGRPQDRWIPYAKYLWQRDRGPIPAGYFVAHADGDRMNDDPANLILIDWATNMQRLYARRPEAIARARAAAGRAAKIRHAANRERRRRHGRPRIVYDCPACGARAAANATSCTKCGGAALERIEVTERDNEKAVKRRRASPCEKPNEIERATQSKKPKCRKRASTNNKPRKGKRARDNEKAKRNKRANIVKKPRRTERIFLGEKR